MVWLYERHELVIDSVCQLLLHNVLSYCTQHEVRIRTFRLSISIEKLSKRLRQLYWLLEVLQVSSNHVVIQLQTCRLFEIKDYFTAESENLGQNLLQLVLSNVFEHETMAGCEFLRIV